MHEFDCLADGFEENRVRLRAVAYRMLGSPSEADDAVQEAWLRFSRVRGQRCRESGRLADHDRRPRVPGHAALRKARREEPSAVGVRAGRQPSGRNRPRRGGAAGRLGRSGAARGARHPGSRRAAGVRPARHVRLPFDEIAPIVGRSPAAARQLASRARRRVRATPAVPDADVAVSARLSTRSSPPRAR